MIIIDYIYLASMLLLFVIVNIGGALSAIKIVRQFHKGEVDGDLMLLVLLIWLFDMFVIL